MTTASNLKTLLKKGGQFTFVGAHNAFIGKLVERAGFDGVYLSGAGLSNSQGVPDTGILTLSDFTYAGKNIARATRLPLLGDADTGFGDVEKTVRSYIESGFSGLHLEDQVFPKRCGHLDGKEVVEMGEMEEKIRLAVKTRDSIDRNFIIIARTDARGAVNIDEKKQFSESVSRGLAYKSAGADVIFPEAMKDREEFEEYRRLVDCPLLANMTEFGKTPFITTGEFAKLGYQIVIFPVSIFRFLAGQAYRALEILKRDGNQSGLVSEMMSRGEINKILGYGANNGCK